jgi:hypothetical protein
MPGVAEHRRGKTSDPGRVHPALRPRCADANISGVSPGRDSLLAHLDEIALPHATPLGALLAQHGVTRSRWYDWNVLRIETAQPFVDGQCDAFERNALGPPFAPDLLPPASFSTFVSTTNDARASHALALAQLEMRFGPATDRATSNTLGHEWRLETARISITSWPPDLERFPMKNPAHERHPELRTFTHLTIATGHVVPLHDPEKRALEALRPLLSGPRTRVPAPSLEGEMLLGSARWLPAELARESPVVGIDDAYVLGVGGRVAFVVARTEVRRLRVVRAAPARGPGWSSIELLYADVFSSRRQERTRTLLRGDRASDLDRDAEALSTRLAVPLDEENGLDD